MIVTIVLDIVYYKKPFAFNINSMSDNSHPY